MDNELKLSHDRIQTVENTPHEIAAATAIVMQEPDADVLLAMLGLGGGS